MQWLCTLSEPLHRLQPLLLASTKMTSGNPNQTCPAPTARPATPGWGCHRPPRPTFAVTVQEHLNSTQDHRKVCTSTPKLSALERGGDPYFSEKKKNNPFGTEPTACSGRWPRPSGRFADGKAAQSAAQTVHAATAIGCAARAVCAVPAGPPGRRQRRRVVLTSARRGGWRPHWRQNACSSTGER